ncbi:hypothetical protein Tco_0755505 [Tanacetum coccineum]
MTTPITTSITTPSAGTFVYSLTTIYQSFSFKLSIDASCHSIVNVITNTKPFPSFLDVGNTLLLHESREDNSKDTTDVVASPSTALFTTTDNIGKGTNRTNKNMGNGHGASEGAGNFNGFIGGGGFAGNTSGTSLQHAQQMQQSVQHTLTRYGYPPHASYYSKLQHGPHALGGYVTTHRP